MPWQEAEKLALSEAGIEDRHIDELTGNTDHATICSLLSKEEVREFTRTILIYGQHLLSAAPTPPAQPAEKVPLTDEDVEWVVNDLGELGVKIGNQFFWLYKGYSLVYEDAKHDDGTPMMWRIVGKREFGETCKPIIHLKVENGQIYDRTPYPYRQELVYTPGLSDGKPEDGA